MDDLKNQLPNTLSLNKMRFLELIHSVLQDGHSIYVGDSIEELRKRLQQVPGSLGPGIGGLPVTPPKSTPQNSMKVPMNFFKPFSGKSEDYDLWSKKALATLGQNLQIESLVSNPPDPTMLQQMSGTKYFLTS